MNNEELNNFKSIGKFIKKQINEDMKQALKNTILNIENISNGQYKITFDCINAESENIYNMSYNKVKLHMSCNCIHGTTVGLNNKIPKNNNGLCKHKMYAFENLEKELRKLK